MLTSDDPEQSCAIGLNLVAGFKAPELAKFWLEKHRILTVAIVRAGEYQRITPNVFSTLEKIDTFGDVMEGIIRKGRLG